MSIKKIGFLVAFFSILSGFVVASPTAVFAITSAELEAQIAQLQAQILQLQQQLSQQKDEPVAFCYDFNVNLRIGDRGEAVTALQTALAKDGSKVWEFKGFDGIFDELTAAEVVGFQQRYRQEVLASYGLQFGTGFVGRTTRAKLNALYECGISRPVTTGIVVTSPQSNQVVSFPLKITGYVNGNGWAGFEGEVGMVEYVNGGRSVASARLKATTLWTQLPTYFEATIPSDNGAPLGAGTLVFSNENPSGLPEKDREFRLPIRHFPPATDVLSITVLSPNSGTVGSTVSILGSGFTPTGNTIHFGVGGFKDVALTSGTALTFQVPSQVSGCDLITTILPCTMPTIAVQPGSYEVYVTNGNGTSNKVVFSVVLVLPSPSPSVSVDIKVNGQDGPVVIPSFSLSNSAATLTWETRGVTSCIASLGGPYDLNGDGFVNIHDVSLYVSKNPGATTGNDSLLKNITDAFGTTGGGYDLNGDGFVNINDISLFTKHNPGATPENNTFLKGMDMAFGTLWGSYDLTRDGFVNIHDISLFLARNPDARINNNPFLEKLIAAFGTSLDTWRGAKNINGQESIGPPPTGRTYVLTCQGANDSISDSVGVIVSDRDIPLSITNLSPVSGAVGTQVTIKGSGFTPGENRVTFGSGVIMNLSSVDRQTLVFNVPQDQVPLCVLVSPRCLLPAPYNLVTPGEYKVSVTNANGTSNTVAFRVVDGSSQKPFITVLSPNGGETLVEGETYTIRWKASGIEKVGISLVQGLAPGRAFWIDQVPASAGSYQWIVGKNSFPEQTNIPGEQFRILINSSKALDESDKTFSIITSLE